MHTTCIHSSADGHLDCCYFLTITNNAIMNNDIQVLCGCIFSFFLGMYLGMELLGHMVSLCLTIWGTAQLFSKMAAIFYYVVKNVWGFPFLYILTNSSFPLFFFYYSHPSGMKWHVIVVFILFIYFWLGWVFVAVRSLLIVVASLVVEHGL